MPRQKLPHKLSNKKFLANINKRGQVATTAKKDTLGVGPWVIAFFLFVVVGSALFQIIRTASQGQ